MFLVLYGLWWRYRGEKSSARRVESSSRLHRVYDWKKDTSWWSSWNWFKWSETVSGVCKVRWLFVQFGSHFEIPWQTAAFVITKMADCIMAAVRSMQNDNLCYFYTILSKGYLFACCMLQDIFVDFLPTILKFSSVWSTRNRIMRFFFDKQKVLFRSEINRSALVVWTHFDILLSSLSWNVGDLALSNLLICCFVIFTFLRAFEVLWQFLGKIQKTRIHSWKDRNNDYEMGASHKNVILLIPCVYFSFVMF